MYGSYSKLVIDSGGAIAAPTAINMSANAANAQANVFTSRPLAEPITVTRFGVQVVTALVYGTGKTAANLVLYKYPGGNISAAVLLQTLELPACAANSVCFADVKNAPADVSPAPATPNDCDAGDVLAIVMNANAAGGSLAGTYQPYITFNPRAEVAKNQALMIDCTP